MNNNFGTKPVKQKPLLGGKVYSRILDGWHITWETDTRYRFWCRLVRSHYEKEVLVVMFNPGSLVGSGAKLRSDTCLRILRRVFLGVPYNCLVTNLFDYASADPQYLFRNWRNRDKYTNRLIYDRLDFSQVHGYLPAYGDYENTAIPDIIKDDIKQRILYVKNKLSGLKEILCCKNLSGTPKHTMNWQREKLVNKIRQQILLSG